MTKNERLINKKANPISPNNSVNFELINNPRVKPKAKIVDLQAVPIPRNFVGKVSTHKMRVWIIKPCEINVLNDNPKSPDNKEIIYDSDLIPNDKRTIAKGKNREYT